MMSLSIKAKLTLILALLTAPIGLLGWFWASGAIQELREADRARAGLAKIEPLWREMARQSASALDDAWDGGIEEGRASLVALADGNAAAKTSIEWLTDPRRAMAERINAGRRAIEHFAAASGLGAQRERQAAYLADLVAQTLPAFLAQFKSASAAIPAEDAVADREKLTLRLGAFVLHSARIGELIPQGVQLLPGDVNKALVNEFRRFSASTFEYRAALTTIAESSGATTAEGRASAASRARAVVAATDGLWRLTSAQLGGRLEAAHEQALAKLVVSGSALLAVLLGALIWSRALSSAILRRIAKLERRIKLLAASDVDGAIPERDGSDEIARIAKAVEKLRTRIVDRMREMMELQEAREFADAANKAKSEFLANMSHELRTPLNAIIGFSELMKLEAFGAVGNERYAGYIEDIHSSAKHLLDLVNDVLDIAKIDARSCDFDICEIEPEQVLEDALGMLKPLISKAQLTANIEIAKGTPKVWADARSVHQIVLNILSNAIKFTPEGGALTLIAAPAELPGGASGVKLAVRDTGPGIAPEDLAKLCTPFHRLSGPHVAKKEGAGLGLAISRSLSQALGGALLFESTVGVGTTAAAVLPAYQKGMEQLANDSDALEVASAVA